MSDHLTSCACDKDPNNYADLCLFSKGHCACAYSVKADDDVFLPVTRELRPPFAMWTDLELLVLPAKQRHFQRCQSEWNVSRHTEMIANAMLSPVPNCVTPKRLSCEQGHCNRAGKVTRHLMTSATVSPWSLTYCATGKLVFENKTCQPRSVLLLSSSFALTEIQL